MDTSPNWDTWPAGQKEAYEEHLHARDRLDELPLEPEEWVQRELVWRAELESAVALSEASVTSMPLRDMLRDNDLDSPEAEAARALERVYASIAPLPSPLRLDAIIRQAVLTCILAEEGAPLFECIATLRYRLEEYGVRLKPDGFE